MKPIVFYDGNCGLCDISVRFLLKIDKRKKLTFSPLQGKTAKKELPKEIRKDLDTVIVKDGKDILDRSNAIIHVLQVVGGIWKLFFIAKVIPRFLRDKMYDLAIKNRYKWFGRECTIYTDKKRFLP